MSNRATGKTTRNIAQALAAISAEPEKTQYIVVPSVREAQRQKRLVADTAAALGWGVTVQDSPVVQTDFGGEIRLVPDNEANRYFRGVQCGNIKYDMRGRHV